MPLRGQKTPREGVGSLPALLLDQGPLPASTYAQALRRREKGKPVARRGRKAHRASLMRARGSRAAERRWGHHTSPREDSTLYRRKEWGT
jgi:hypothetical protein